ncbi:MAG: hypothetical protein QOH06_5699 [Acidobacteriota bacterium]|jgi:hypothetical protein|nr:hypothetical protein [Acidobacteriota bacterium]
MKLKPPFLTLTVLLCFLALACGPPKELSRDKALELLRAAPPGMLGDATSDNLVSARFTIERGKNVQCETQKRLALAEQLVSEGVLTKSVRDLPEETFHWGKRRAGTEYRFQVANPAYASLPSDQYTFVILTMGKPRIAEVTGIKQEGSTAIVEALIDFEPTPVFETLVKTETSFAQGGPDKQCSEIYSLPDPQTGSFRFERYDDGWRLHS